MLRFGSLSPSIFPRFFLPFPLLFPRSYVIMKTTHVCVAPFVLVSAGFAHSALFVFARMCFPHVLLLCLRLPCGFHFRLPFLRFSVALLRPLAWLYPAAFSRRGDISGAPLAPIPRFAFPPLSRLAFVMRCGSEFCARGLLTFD